MKLLEIGAPADLCPLCIQLKTWIKRMIRKGVISLEFEYVDGLKNEEARKIVFEYGGWYFNPEEPDKPNWFTPQLFIVDDQPYFIFGKPLVIFEDATETILKRIDQFLKTKKNEERRKLAQQWLTEDICDPDAETIIFDEGTILPVLRPVLCKKVLEKINDERIKRQAEIVKKLMSQKIQNK